MKCQRRWYKICVRGLCVKLLKLKINVRLSAEVCLPQRLSVHKKHALHFVQNLEIPKSVTRNFDRYGICMKCQRRWYKICVRGLCGKMCKVGVKTVDFPFYRPCLWCCCFGDVLHFNVTLFHWKSFQPFGKFSIWRLCSSAGGLFVCARGGLDIVKLTKTPLFYSVSRFILGELGALFGGAKPTKTPSWRRDWPVHQSHGTSPSVTRK